jgi:hypothetical protein
MLALIQIEKASKWAIKNSPEVNEHLIEAIKLIKAIYDAPVRPIKSVKNSNVVIVRKAPLSVKSINRKTIDFNKQPVKLKGLNLCDFCFKEHLNCKRLRNKLGGSLVICVYCEDTKLNQHKFSDGVNKSQDLLNHTVSGSYGSGKKR